MTQYLLYGYGPVNNDGTEISYHTARGTFELVFLPDQPPPELPRPIDDSRSNLYLIHTGLMLGAWSVSWLGPARLHTRDALVLTRGREACGAGGVFTARAGRIVLSPLGTLLARYFKLVLRNWFAIHRLLMLSALLVTLAGLLVVWIGACLPHDKRQRGRRGARPRAHVWVRPSRPGDVLLTGRPPTRGRPGEAWAQKMTGRCSMIHTHTLALSL